uniref:Cyclin G2 n=1 Tax=Fundulus heteroclitus TaxID=8078 RepID=A0A3Q2PK97_FUNHE
RGGKQSKMEAVRLMKELRANYEQEADFLPRETGLNLIVSADAGQITARSRDVTVEDLWSLTSFFGFSTQTFVLAVSLLDRFLAMMRVQPKHLSCVSLSCLHMAARETEEECNQTASGELIRIGQCRFTVSDLCRMEKIVAEKLRFKSKAVTALTFLQLYHQITLTHATYRSAPATQRRCHRGMKTFNIILEYLCGSLTILSVILQDQSYNLRESCEGKLNHKLISFLIKIADAELQRWGERVARCLSDYASPKCSKPDHRKLQWIVSRRTAQNLHSHRSAPELPTIPEDCWDESER